MDSGIGPRPWNSVGRELLVVARAKANAASTGRKDRNPTAEDPRAGTGMDSHVTQRTACEGKSTHQFLRSSAQSGNGEARAGSRNLYSPRAPAGAGRH